MVPQLYRHQVSLESVIDPFATPPLSSYDRTRSQSIFQHIVQYCESYELLNTITPTRKYKRGRLLQLVYVNDTRPIWFYCSQTSSSHCQSGMVGAINAHSTGDTLEAFITLG
ncbi:hypothetical protein B0J14DRAFT_601027 [Halenospora varia]|nr:hypothetical protein B0J14DRAFT_601027 [Halenospora varia]